MSRDRMGWNTASGDPTFLVGCLEVSATGLRETDTNLGKGLGRASRLGVDVPQADWQAPADLGEVLATYRASWTNPAHAALVLATALRPVVPLRANMPVVLSGRSESVRRFTTSAMLAFWQSTPDTWAGHGYTSDRTIALADELGKAPIWVVDGLHETYCVTKNIHDGSPHAVFVVAGRTAPEVADTGRAIHIKVTRDFLAKDTRRLFDLSTGTTTAARVTGAVIQGIARRGQGRGWAEEVTSWEAQYTRTVGQLRETVGVEASARLIESAANLALGLDALLVIADGDQAAEIRQWKAEMLEHVTAAPRKSRLLALLTGGR